MKTKNPITVLLENGIHFSTLTNMSEKQIKILAEKFKKEEPKEVETIQKTVNVMKIKPAELPNFKGPDGNYNIPLAKEGEVTEDVEVDKDDATAGEYTQSMTQKSAPDGMDDDLDNPNEKNSVGVAESKINEKFESKAQQGLFWARCNKCKTEDCKWCKMAKEFSKNTRKKDYEKMPEKKHPEKSVKRESYEKFLEDRIVEMVYNHLNPKLTKNNSQQQISEKSENFMLRKPKKMSMFSDESGIEMKKMNKPIGKIYSLGKSHMEENDTKEKERTKEREKTTTPKRRDNPFKNPNPGVKEKPRGSKEDEKEDVKMTFINQIKQALR